MSGPFIPYACDICRNLSQTNSQARRDDILPVFRAAGSMGGSHESDDESGAVIAGVLVTSSPFVLLPSSQASCDEKVGSWILLQV